MGEYIYVNTEPGHFKMWGYDSFRSESGPHEVILYWGRIGTPMHKLQKKRKNFASWGDAYDFVRNKVDDKTRNGYRMMQNHKYFGLLHEKPLSALVKAIEKLPRLE